jgi:hypothetical protein
MQTPDADMRPAALVSPAKKTDWPVLLLVAGTALVLQLAAIRQYGYFRDELYYLASTEHLDWGYVDHPPLSIAVLALVRALLGDSLPAVRLVPALSFAITVLLTGLLARRLGAGRFGQGLAAFAALFAPVFIAQGHYYSMNALDLLFWTIAALLLVTALEEGRPRTWIGLGVVLGLGLLNKLSVLWLGAGLFAGLIASPQRRVLGTRWPWLAAAIAGAIFAPHVLWQARHGWPTLEFMRNATATKMVSIQPLGYLRDQVLSMNPASAPLWMGGLVFGLVARAGEKGRVLAWLYLVVLGLLLASGSARASYLAVAYPGLFALGAIALERLSAPPKRGSLRALATAVVVVSGAVLLPMALPLLPVERFVQYQAALGLEPRSEEQQQMGVLPQHYADMFGWDDMVALAAEAHRRLTPDEQRRCRVFGQNYGEAGAIDVLGRKLGLPPALSGHNSYWLWGQGAEEPHVIILIGGAREENARFFEQIEIVGQTRSPWSMPYERGLDVSIGRRPKVPLRELWPALKRYI